MRSFPRRWFLSFLVAASAGLAAGCGRGDGDGIRVSGQVEATEVRVSSKIGGFLLSVTVQEGDTVHAGSVIAVVDSIDFAIARRMAAADRDRAAANLKLVLAGSRAEDVRVARADVTAREADLDGAELELSRQEALVATGNGAAKPRDDARVRRDVAKAQLSASKETLARLEHGARPEEISAARAALDAAQARLAAADQDLGHCLIRAPLEGIVTSKLSESGEQITPGTGIAIVSDVRHPWLTAFVDGNDLPRVKLGEPARVLTDRKGDPGRTGHVTFVSPTAEFTPRNVQTRDERAKLVYRVKVLVPNEDGVMKPGMPADAILGAAK